jgi:hypothetical protein
VVHECELVQRALDTHFGRLIRQRLAPFFRSVTNRFATYKCTVSALAAARYDDVTNVVFDYASLPENARACNVYSSS